MLNLEFSRTTFGQLYQISVIGRSTDRSMDMQIVPELIKTSAQRYLALHNMVSPKGIFVICTVVWDFLSRHKQWTIDRDGEFVIVHFDKDLPSLALHRDHFFILLGVCNPVVHIFHS